MKVTLRDVAKHAGISVTTVSRALNGYDDVAEETKKAIYKAADELGYTPNLNARRLKLQRAEAIGLILPKENLRFSDPFFSDLLSGIVEQSAALGLEINVTTPQEDNDVKATYMRYINSRRVDGFIIVRVERDDERIKFLQELNYPFVAFGRVDGRNNFPYVDEDGNQGIKQIINHLVELGHSRIACITEPQSLAKTYTRLQGYKEGLADHKIELDPSLIVEGSFRQRSGRLCALQLLDLDQPPTAIVAVNDLMAIGAMQAAKERGLQVGKQISITGFDDILLSEYATPPLTTLHQPAHQMGALLCETLVNTLKGKPLTELQTILPPSIVLRESTGEAP